MIYHLLHNCAPVLSGLPSKHHVVPICNIQMGGMTTVVSRYLHLIHGSIPIFQESDIRYFKMNYFYF